MKTTVRLAGIKLTSSLRNKAIAAVISSGLGIGSVQAAELQPGMYRFWNSAQEQPVGLPSKSFCVTAIAAKNPVTLNGEIVGDAGCSASPLVTASQNSATFTLTCANSKIIGKATVVFAGEKATTAINWTGAAMPKSYVHAQRVGAC